MTGAKLGPMSGTINDLPNGEAERLHSGPPCATRYEYQGVWQRLLSNVRSRVVWRCASPQWGLKDVVGLSVQVNSLVRASRALT